MNAAAHAPPPDWRAMERALAADPGGRGVPRLAADSAAELDDQLSRACHDLAQARRVVIVTGFCIPRVEPPAAETDGPPGALLLARALFSAGIPLHILTDDYGAPLVETGLAAHGLPAEILETMPLGASQPRGWIDHWLASRSAEGLSHAVAIERPGPSHTPDTLRAQRRSGPPPLDWFVRETPAIHQNVCHNMRGQSIEVYSAPLYLLFDAIRERNLPVTTIAVGDGGNEIGMGKLPWELLRETLGDSTAGRTISRVAADLLVLSGVSNWGGYALALGTAALAGSLEPIAAWTPADEFGLIERIVREGGAVDGVTARREPTVDGLAWSEHARVYGALRSACGPADGS